MILAAQLLQEPVDGVLVIARPSRSERRARDQRPDRPPGVELHSDATEHSVDLRRLVAAKATAEPRGADLVAVHERSITLWPGHRRRARLS